MSVEVIQDEQLEEVTIEVLTQSIVKISDGMEKLLDGPLHRRALLLLLRDQTGLGEMEMHERDEWLRLDGELVNDPHAAEVGVA